MPHKNLLLNFKRPTPRTIHYEVSEDDQFYGKITAYPFERGYGTTVANSLRRVLLSSLPGYAISGLSIKYYDKNGDFRILSSEFENIPGVFEDTIEIVQNLKKVRLVLHDDSIERKIFIELKGKKEFKASDLAVDSNIQIFNQDEHIATLNEDAFFTIEVTITLGRGYVPGEAFLEGNSEIGFIPVDALYSPIQKATFQVENYRIEQRTDYEKFSIEVWSDGSIRPVDAVADAAKILKEHFNTFINFDEAMFEVEEKGIEKSTDINPDDEALLKKLLTSIEELELNARASNCLNSADVKFIGELVIKSEEDLARIKNLGQKSLKEIKEKLSSYQLELGMPIDKKLIEKIDEAKIKGANFSDDDENIDNEDIYEEEDDEEGDDE
ncbi:MAG: DNA-directed RNA polymerase subunit alpha [Spirochaetes bacterium GWB1_36_13]|nr:MAG: DNA-directed RNA polymerase subunit alpha [Spirochaetes bacterium GWB1_36_13]